MVALVATGVQARADEKPSITQAAKNLLPEAPPIVSLPSWSPLVRRVLPAVVNVTAEISPDAAAAAEQNEERQAAPSLDDFLRRYFEEHGLNVPLPPGTRTGGGGKMMSAGSAFIIDPTGYVVTNNHVIANASKITVILQDNTRHAAEVVGTDAKIDIALLKISTRHKLPVLQWGDSNKVSVGDWVMAVGNPFGLGGTVTAGIVSALGRDLQQGPFDDFLQIDAPINHGNSGGPTLDLEGKVVGINSAIYSPSGGSVGIGFAIPSNIAKVIVQKLRDSGHAEHGFLGFSLQAISPDIADALHLDSDKPQGLLVNDVVPQSPAATAGLQAGDIIIEANGQPVQVTHDISKFVINAKLGDVLRLTALRFDKMLKLNVTLIKTPSREELAAWMEGPTASHAAAPAALGLWFANLTDDLRRELQLAPTVQGVVIGGIQPKSPAAAIGLVPGDVVISINRQTINDPAKATNLLLGAATEGDVLILVNRHGDSQFMVLTPPGSSPSDHPN
jgi:serine protease Do